MSLLPKQSPRMVFALLIEISYKRLMFVLLDKIDKALESKARCTLIHKMGHYYHGTLTDSWVRLSAGKMRGKVQFTSEEKGPIEVDANDILDVVFPVGSDTVPATNVTKDQKS